MGSYPKAAPTATQPGIASKSSSPVVSATLPVPAASTDVAHSDSNAPLSQSMTPSVPFTNLVAHVPASSSANTASVAETPADVGDQVFWSQLLAHSYTLKSRDDMPKQPWERAPWAKVSSAFNITFSLPNVGFSDFMAGKDPGEPASVAPLPTIHPEYARKRLKLAALSAEPDAVRTTCLRKLRTMILLDPSTSELALSLVDAAGRLVEEATITKSFVDSFAPKATSTILKRTTHLWGFCSFVTDRKLGSPLEFQEPVVYGYLNFMRDSSRGATAPASFLQSIGFLHGVVRLTSFPHGVLISARCSGLAKSESSRKRPTKQSTVLTTDQVWGLERFVVNNAPSFLSAIGGHILFCIYSCARWSDSMALDKIEEFISNQIVLVETATSHHKTASASGDASMLLPLLCLGRCLFEKPWSTAWIKSRRKFGLDSSEIAMPTYHEQSGKFGTTRMSSSEASLWIRELLCLTGTSEQVADTVSSHGLKATLLSWVAKSGKFSTTEQRCLGHHFDPELRSVLIYSRDSYAPLAAKIRLMLDSILSGAFNPDAPRHVRIDELVREALSDSSESDASDFGACANTTLRKEGSIPLPIPEGLGNAARDQIYVHAASGIAHASFDGTKLLCGRPLIAVYKSLDDVQMEASDLVICKQCGRAA